MSTHVQTCASGPALRSRSGVSRLTRRLFPFLTAAAILSLGIALGASYSRLTSRLWSVEQSVSNMSQSLSSVEKLTADAAKDVERLKFGVASAKDELRSTSEALKQLATLDTISRVVASLQCSVEHIIKNGSTSVGSNCCPLDWQSFGSNCYFYGRSLLSWHDARDWCNGHESHLAIILTDKEWDFVQRESLGAFFWVGLTDERTGSWEWVNQDALRHEPQALAARAARQLDPPRPGTRRRGLRSRAHGRTPQRPALLHQAALPLPEARLTTPGKNKTKKRLRRHFLMKTK
ncbi:asialoglycoprotein receptor 2 [Phycodurus eques]|uniref:asialoglycoprotein receptor 2 n=1 Tax=Phycodurus eques TaxID=693459 RepID=UPI002ACECC47|nr:asialoglycoprotein receptor 2 [Phycodurus eques]